jgi:histidine triad (HIT) family protein
MENCIFCKIIKNELPSHKVYEDEETLAFLDIHPNNPGHTLVVPKDHFENIYGTPDETIARMILVAKKIAVAIKNGLDADGINITMNNEAPAGQAVFHSHIHVIPRIKTDGFQSFPRREYKEGEVEEVLEKIKTNIN